MSLSRFKLVLKPNPAFFVATALAMLVLRLMLFDAANLFSTSFVPSHDVYKGTSHFTISMHSMRLNGDIAWWNPISSNGYAQYFQLFVSPLAPTANHIVYIVWAQMIRILSFVGISLPEYLQFLAVNFIILPFLTFTAFTYFCSHIFRRRPTIVLVALVYTLSGIGLWNAAWFYFQESFSLFFLLGACLGLLQRPNVPRLMLFLTALLIQLVSFNYWTIYNSWFIVLLLGFYGWMHYNQVRRLYSRTLKLVKQHKRLTALVTAMSVVTLMLWAAITASTLLEQSNSYIRSTLDGRSSYTIEEAYNKVQEIRKYSTDLFNPSLERALEYYKINNPVHNARYIGAFLLPFLLLLPLYRWRRREKWLTATAVGIFIIALAPPVLLELWQLIPFMDRVVHFFYMYSHYWQLMVVLLAGLSFDMLLSREFNAAVKRRFIIMLGSFCGVLGVVLLFFMLFSQYFPKEDIGLQANLKFVLLALFSSFAILQFLQSPRARRSQLLVVTIIVLTLTDLTRYFWDVTRIDQKFSAEKIIGLSPPLADATQAALRQPWAVPDPNQGLKAGFYKNMPVANQFWPENFYLFHRFADQVQRAPSNVRDALSDTANLRSDFDVNDLTVEDKQLEYMLTGIERTQPLLEFYSKARVVPDPTQIANLPTDEFKQVFNQNQLLLQGKPDPALVSAPDAHNFDKDLSFDLKNLSQWQSARIAPIPVSPEQPSKWKVASDPQLIYKPELNVCMADYDYVYIKIAASTDIIDKSRMMQILYNVNGQKDFRPWRGITVSLPNDEELHSFMYPIKNFKLNPQDRLTGLRLDPVVEGTVLDRSEVQIEDFRLISADTNNNCSGNATQPAASSSSINAKWGAWDYNTYNFEVEAPQTGWLLIRQLYDPLWKVTVDGQAVQPTRANFTGMGLHLTQGRHTIRLDYQPLARRLYWPASFLLEATLLLLLIIAWRTRRKRHPAQTPSEQVIPASSQIAEPVVEVSQGASKHLRFKLGNWLTK